MTHSRATSVYRRSLFDIRAQLMAEADPSAQHDKPDSAESLLHGLENGDLSSGVYEGGFKTWECALDLASLLVGSDASPIARSQTEKDWEVIELGAGSAVPSLAILQSFLQGRASSDEKRTTNPASLKLTLCDYNAEVLRLATAPNLLLNYLSATNDANLFFDSGANALEDEGDLDIEDLGGSVAIVEKTTAHMQADNLSLDFISGGWGDEFVDLVSPPLSQKPNPRAKNLLILASETIYSPATIRTFSSTLVHLLRNHAKAQAQRDTPDKTHARAWVAAKKVYFGVGGGVDEFVQEIEQLGATTALIFEGQGTGVGRVVLEITIL
jgi:protein-histidine N-methyltransferase